MSKKTTNTSEKNSLLEVNSNIYSNLSSETDHRKTPPLFHLRKLLYSKLYHKYSTGRYSWTRISTDFLIYNEKCRIVARFKDFLILDDNNEYIKKFYPEVDSKPRLKKIFKFYECYSKIFPNYLVIEENKYLYKNIRRKQKMIDAINAIKNEEKENRKHINRHSNKNKNIFFTKPINEEIRKYIENASFKKNINNSFDSDNKNNSNTILINYSINQSEQSILLNSFINNEPSNSICDIMNVLNDNKIYMKDISPKKTTKIKTFNKTKKNNTIKKKDTISGLNNKNVNKKNIKNNNLETEFPSPNKKIQEKKNAKKNFLATSTKTNSTLTMPKHQKNPSMKLNPSSLSKRDLFENYKENLKTDKNINSNCVKKKLKKNYYKTQSNFKKIVTETKKKKSNFVSQDFTNYSKKNKKLVNSLSNHKKINSNLLSHEIFKTEGEFTDSKYKVNEQLLTEQKTYKKIYNSKENNNILNTQTNSFHKNALTSSNLMKQKTEFKMRKIQVKKLDFKNTKAVFKKVMRDRIKRNLLCKSTFNFYDTKKNINTIDTNNNSSKAISNFNKTVSKGEFSNNNKIKIINQKKKLITGKTQTKLHPKLIVSPTKRNVQTNTTYNNFKIDLNSKRTEYKSYLTKKNKKRSCDMDEEYKKNISQKIIDKMSKNKNMSINSKFYEKKNMDTKSNIIGEKKPQHMRTLTEYNKLNVNKNSSHKTLDLHEFKPKKIAAKKKSSRKDPTLSEKKKEGVKIENLKKDAKNKISDKEKASKKE